MVDKAPNPAGGPQQRSKLRCSGGVRMLIMELRGTSRHCALLLRQEVWLGYIELFDSRVEFGTHVGRQWNSRLSGCQRGKNRHMVRRISTTNASTLIIIIIIIILLG